MILEILGPEAGKNQTCRLLAARILRMRTLASLITITVLGAGAWSCGQPQAELPPFNPAFSVAELMEGPIVHAAEVYWGSVSTIVDARGITENFPQNDEEWEAVWAAGITLAESGNLLMISPRAQDQDDWIEYASGLVTAGIEATAAAQDKNPDKVLEVGERVYNACVACHEQYLPEEE